jgi:hypothetical protein
MLWQIFDKIRQMIMIKIDLRQRIAAVGTQNCRATPG